MSSEKGKAIIVGGSISGISCALSLVEAGWDVVVLEKTTTPPTGSPTGAGLGLDPLSQKLIESWLGSQSHLLHKFTLPLSIDQNQVTTENQTTRILTRDECFNFKAAYWADLHSLLYGALPPSIVYWGHSFLSYCISEDKRTVQVKAKVLQTGDVVDISSDLLIAADGCLSSIRQTLLPDFKLRYSGYCAWRGVLGCPDNEYSEAILDLKKAYPDLGKCLYFDLGSRTHSVFYELLNKRINWIWYINQPEPERKTCHSEYSKKSAKNDEAILDLKKAYPDLGKCLYFDLGSRTHSVFYELLNKRINWIWYINQPEPERKGNSVTMKVSRDMITEMHEAAEKVWTPELVKVIKETNEPFLNVIYDSDPLERVVWDNVVFIGDAAHPTTPHGLRSTNMSIVDAAVLGKCLKKFGVQNLHSALQEYQSIRLPVTSKQVLHSRKLGRIKQGLDLPDHEPFDPMTASPADCQQLQQMKMPSFADIPSILA